MSNILIQDEAESAGMIGLLHLMTLFDVIDENFLRCWNGSCENVNDTCRFLDRTRAISIHHKLEKSSPFQKTYDGNRPNSRCASDATLTATSSEDWCAHADLKDTQKADILINQQWLQNRLWNVCLSHNLLSETSSHPALLISQSLSIAEATLRLCTSMSLSSFEVHGVGIVSQALRQRR